MARSQAEINERRQRRSKSQPDGESPGDKDLKGYGIGKVEISVPQAELQFRVNPATAKHIRFPARDLDPVNNYRSEMWAMIKDHFQGGEPAVAVEVGSRRGAWASGLMDHTSSTRLFCVDIWGGRPGFGDLGAWFKRMEPWAFTRAFPLKGTGVSWSRIFPYQFDLVFIDAIHDYNSARNDFSSWFDMLSPGGLLIGHDWQLDDVQKAATDVFEGRISGIKHLGLQKAVSFWVKK